MRNLIVTLVLVLTTAVAGKGQQSNHIANPGFENVANGRAERWSPFEAGYELDDTVKHAGSYSVRCVNATSEERRGASYSFELNQKTAAPVLVTGWSKANGVGGFANNDYSIYVDLVYQDGTPLWGQTAPFATGTHDWQRKQVLIIPSKPLKSAVVHALFRSHSGTVWFDDFNAIQLSGTDMFDSQLLSVPNLPVNQNSGWFIRDVAANSQLAPMKTGVAVLGIKPVRVLNHKTTGSALIQDATGKPRAVTIYYVERFAAPSTVWWNNARQSVATAANGEYSNLTRVGNVGATGAQSLYPFGCVTANGKGLMLGIPPSMGPVVARIGYHADSKLLYAAFDVALTGENQANSVDLAHGTASVAVMHRPFDPEWGFRAATAAYYTEYPTAFQRRATADGLWIPFTNPSTVKDVQDFGFAFHEGDGDIQGDDKLSILSFRYTEPMTWWMAMPKEMPRTLDAAQQMVRNYLTGTNEEEKRWSQAVKNSGTYDENGKPNVEFQNAPWTNGAVWNLNPNPAMPHPAGEQTKATLSYTKELGDKMYGSGAKGVQDGEYLDSIEGWADILDYRPDAIKYSHSVPTFAADTHRAVLPTWFSTWELANFMSEDLHKRGKLLMANATPWRINAFLPLLDVAGTETNWLPGGTWRPDPDDIFLLRRTLCYHKPYLLLQNTDFNKFGRAEVEKYFQRSMAYGVFPSMFSVDASTDNYWDTPKWHNRDRDLFKRYIPTIKTLSAAGWEPVTFARSGASKVYVERFGKQLLTVLNDDDNATSTEIVVHLGDLGIPTPSGSKLIVTNMVSGAEVANLAADKVIKFTLDLKPEEARALKLEVH